MRISDWSSDVCSSDLVRRLLADIAGKQAEMLPQSRWVGRDFADAARAMHEGRTAEDMIHGQASPEEARRSEEHTSELQSLMRISYAVFCLKKTNNLTRKHYSAPSHPSSNITNKK